MTSPPLPAVARGLTAAILTLVLCAAALLGPTPRSAAASAGPPLVWGMSGVNTRSEIQDMEAKVGRQFGAVRLFYNWDSAFPESDASWIAASNRVPLISVNARRENGTVVQWRDIAEAQPGSPLYDTVVAWAVKIKAYGVPVYFAFNHEPEASASGSMGTDLEFIAAYQKFTSIFRDNTVINAKMIWIMTANSYVVGSSDRRFAQKWYPGDYYVDALGIDAYNNYTCTGTGGSPWKSLRAKIEPFRVFGQAHPTKELWLPEWATAEDPNSPNRKAQWITEAQALFKEPGYEQFRGVLYFNLLRRGTPCEWFVDSDEASLQAFTNMGQDPFYQGYIDAASVDDQAPTTPQGLRATGMSSSSVSVAWTGSTDNTAVTGYNLYRDGILAVTVKDTQATVTGLAPGTTYVFTVKARDEAGNLSVASNSVPVATSGSPSGVVLSKGRPAGASSVVSTTYNAPKAVDWSQGTRWASAAGSKPQWIRVNLGASHRITSVKLTWATEYGRAYVIQTSPDGTTWRNVYETTTGDGGTDHVAVSGTGSWIRIYATRRAVATGGYSLFDLSVYGA